MSRKRPISLETLELRSLLSGGGTGYPSLPPAMPAPVATPPPVVAPITPVASDPGTVSAPAGPAPAKLPTANRHGQKAQTHVPTGIVSKSPHFYAFYTGPKWAELNAVRASGELSPSGTFTFTGTVQGSINKAPATYVWGIDRNGNLPPGPFTDRPNVRFDAVIVVSLKNSLTPTASVVDLDSGATTAFPASAVTIHGHTLKVTLSDSLLPSTGLSPSQYRFNFWPEDGGPPVSASVASFVPESTTVQVGRSK